MINPIPHLIISTQGYLTKLWRKGMDISTNGFIHQYLKSPFTILALLFLTLSVHAVQPACDQVNENGKINAPGGCIVKSLQEQIGTGQGDEFTPGSSVYLIKRDPARSVRRGHQLFQRKFSSAEGQGPRVNHTSTGDITENPALGAGLADSCAACHGRPRDSAGFGGEVTTRPDSRDSPHLFGLGIVEQLADEMTTQLRQLRDEALIKAKETSQCVTRDLKAKDIPFGAITACPDGSVDTAQVTGVDPDLRIKPFFHHGQTISMREFIIGALNDEMGLQAWDPILCAVTDPESPTAMTSHSGFVFDPAKDTFERPKVCDALTDADNDGVANEIDPALVDHLEFYLLNYLKPGTYEQTRSTKRGLRLMHKIGCTSCHKQNLVIESDRRIADIETDYQPEKAIFNGLYSELSTMITAVDDGDQYPMLLPKKEPFKVHNFFSDLKRHDLGPAFHERQYDGSIVTHFVTEPLWGVGSTGPYGHDGRSINLDQVIRRHGGEAESSKQAYVNLKRAKREQVLAFLESLILFPPDDTASNLAPGNPGTNNPQDPDEHGSVLLPALFQIPEEGEDE